MAHFNVKCTSEDVDIFETILYAVVHPVAGIGAGDGDGGGHMPQEVIVVEK